MQPLPRRARARRRLPPPLPRPPTARSGPKASRARPLLVLVLALALLVGAGFGAAPTAAGQAEPDVEWARFDVTLELRKDGSFHVVERQVVDFGIGSFRTAFAEIPLDRIAEVRNVVVREETAISTVTFREEEVDRYGFLDAGTYRWDASGNVLSVEWAFDQAFAEQRTFLLEYDAVGALRAYPNPPPPAEPNQQIWWTAIGQETTAIAPVRAASMTIRLPRPIDPAGAVVAENDAVGEPAAHTDDGQTWTWRAGDLGAGDELTVRLQFPPLVAAVPSPWLPADNARVAREEAAVEARRQREAAAADRRALVNTMLLGAGLLGVVAGGVGLYGWWYARGRDPETGVVAEFLPEPPDDLGPGAAGALVDEIVHQRDVVATLVDMARRGILGMREVRDIFASDAEITLLQNTTALTPLEQQLVNVLFDYTHTPGQTVRLGAVSACVAEAGPDLRRRLYTELVDRGYFATSPEETRQGWRDRALQAFLVLLIGGGAAGAILARNLAWSWFPLGVAALLAVAIYLLSGALPRKTAAGAEAAARWRAFRRYLERIERYEEVDAATAMFDRYLPYAVAFGLEASWVETFARAEAPVPRWYRGGRDGETDTSFESASSGSGSWSRRHETERDGSPAGHSWWEVADGWDRPDADRHDRHGGQAHQRSRSERRGGDEGWSLPDWQGTSDHAGQALQGASNGLLSMFNGAGRALSAIGEAAVSGGDNDDGGGRSGGGSFWSSGGGSTSSRSSRSSSTTSRRSSSRSFGGGGRSGGSSGGGRRGFG